ncbi:MAG TPA: EAL domain-containing response regulator [Acetobacteraceae bacterium]|nr:EAL domain-containing response regulator [Acetobacteraceae bacterium]
MDTLPNPSRRLLVVDDEPPQCLLVARTVARLGYATDIAMTLDEASAQLAVRRYDAVVLDLSLAEEAVNLLHALRGMAAQAALVLVSRLDERLRAASLWLASALGLRVAGALPKPIVPAALQVVLRDAPAAPASHDLRCRISAAELEDAVRQARIVAAFQPQVSLADRQVVGAEALARWRHPAGDVPPDLFVPLAERSGLIVPLTFSILRQALGACRRWRDTHPHCTVAVNFSPLVLADPGLPAAVERLLRENGLGPGALTAEITESTVIGHPLVAAEVLRQLRDAGVRLSIDDFGTGQSSLMTLHRLPYAELKIDRAFVTGCDTDPQALKIVRATLSIAREMGLAVVAEGIETEPEEALLREAGCETGQGWRYGRAMPEAEFRAWLAGPGPHLT